ncbi:MAG TPA: ABC transporter permease subunit [Pseudolabrys sp.]|jgi:NitT/TauT family transport system permease protein|nr:ABC transporter permease subunit [Pseudolabrys sp.]
MTDAAVSTRAPGSYLPRLVGFATIVAALLLAEVIIRIGWISRFIVPPPSEIAASFGQLFAHEHIVARFFYTAGECLVAGVMITLCGIGIGVLMHSIRLLQQACETWVAALASAPFVLAYPLFMVIFGRNAWTIIVMGFVAGLPPVILKTIEGISGTRRVLVNVGRSFNLTANQQFWKILFPAAMPTIFVGVRLGLIFALINIVGTEFLINFGGLGQLINDLAERYDLGGTYAAICFVILVSVCFFMTLEKAERWLRPVD